MCVMIHIFGLCDMAMQGKLNFMQGQTRILDLLHLL